MLADRISKWREELKAEGKAIGEAIGKAIGEARGEARGEAKILCRMKEAGMSLFEISRITGLSEDEIAHLI
jgi:predicted transposase YdaD